MSVSEHYFDIDTYKPWEFNSTFPIRTIVYPFVSVGIPYSIISNLLQYSSRLGINLKSVYFLVTLPRLLMCMLSFVNDYCLYKICRINDLDHNKCLVIFSSSYVMLTYASRTFSNNSELILFSLLLYYVSRCIDFSNKVKLFFPTLAFLNFNARRMTFLNSKKDQVNTFVQSYF